MPRVIWSVPRGKSVVTPGFAPSKRHLAERPDRFNFPQPTFTLPQLNHDILRHINSLAIRVQLTALA